MTLEETKAYSYWVLRRVSVIIAIILVISAVPIGRDSTDPEWPGRSGMRLNIDSATGCAYLSAPSGGITPRLTSTGQHYGCTETKE